MKFFQWVFASTLVFLAAGSSPKAQCPQKAKELSESERIAHARKLGKSSKDATKDDIAALTAYLQDKSPDVRCVAISRLGAIFFDQKQPCSLELTQTLLDRDADVRATAATCLAFAKIPDGALPVLLKALQSEDTMVRQNVTLLFFQWGKDAKVVAALKKAMQDKDFAVRNNAGVALGQILDDLSFAVPCWLEAIGKAEENALAKKPLADKEKKEAATVNVIAIGAAQRFHDLSKEDPKKLAEVLIKQLDNPSPLIRRIAVRELGAMAVDNPKAAEVHRSMMTLNTLERLLEDPDPGMRLEAKSAIKRIQP